MDTTNVTTTVDGAGERQFAIEEGGCLILTMINGKPQSKLLTSEQWTALHEGVVNEAEDYFTSGSEVQQEAYRLFHSLAPIPEESSR